MSKWRRPEDAFWHDEIKPTLKHFGVLHRVENSIEEGMPDVCYCLRKTKEDGPAVSGWIENKHVHKWPSRPNSFLRFKRFTKQQADWLYDWSAVGGKACVLAKVGTDYFLMSGLHAKQLREGMTRSQIMGKAAVVGLGVFPVGRIVLWLTEK